MPGLSRRGLDAPPSPIRKLAPLADAARARGVTVYHVNIGQPDLPTPEPMRRAVASYDADVYAYAPSGGTPACRRAMQEYYRRALQIDVADDEFLVTTAGSEAIQFALASCLNPGDTVLIPEPLYPNYLGFAAMLGVEVKPIPCSIEDGYHLPADPDRFMAPGVRAVLFANPGNPTGTVYRPEEIRALAALALREDLFVIADEVYREFVFSGTTLSVLSIDELRDHAIVVDSMSKRFSACGIRIGALVSRNHAIVQAAQRFAMARLSPPALGQVAAAAITEIPHDYFPKLREVYRRRRDAVVGALRNIQGVRCPQPEGAFYTMVGLPLEDTDDFARFLLADFAVDGETVMVAPGSGFYKTPGGGRDEVRIAYVLDEKRMRRAIEILGLGIEAYCARVAAGAPTSAPSHTPSKA